MNTRLHTIGYLIVALLFLALGALARPAIGGEPEVQMELRRATVVYIHDTLEWQTPRTLLEFENGQRASITGYYGAVGDTFLIQRPATR